MQPHQVNSLFGILLILFWLVLLGGLTWSWVRWAQIQHHGTVSYVLSLIALALATATVPLAVLHSFYPGSYGVLQFIAVRVSFVAVFLALIGAVRSNPLRWHSLACSTGLFTFWFLALLSR